MKLINNFADVIIFGSAVYHLIMGLACLAGVSFIFKAIRFLYQIQMPEQLDPRVEYAIKPIGAFAVWTALVCGLSFIYRHEPWVSSIKIFLAILFLLRAFFRFKERELFLKAFGVSWQRSRWNVLFNIFLSIILLFSGGCIFSDIM